MENWRGVRNQSRNFPNCDKRYKSRGSLESRLRRNVKCYNCGKMERYTKEWRLAKRDEPQDRNGDRKREQKQNTTAIASDGNVVFIHGNTCVNLTYQNSCWVVNTTASFHVTSQCNYFTSYRNGDFGWFRMTNGGSSKIIGI